MATAAPTKKKTVRINGCVAAAQAAKYADVDVIAAPELIEEHVRAVQARFETHAIDMIAPYRPQPERQVPGAGARLHRSDLLGQGESADRAHLRPLHSTAARDL